MHPCKRLFRLMNALSSYCFSPTILHLGKCRRFRLRLRQFYHISTIEINLGDYPYLCPVIYPNLYPVQSYQIRAACSPETAVRCSSTLRGRLARHLRRLLHRRKTDVSGWIGIEYRNCVASYYHKAFDNQYLLKILIRIQQFLLN